MSGLFLYLDAFLIFTVPVLAMMRLEPYYSSFIQFGWLMVFISADLLGGRLSGRSFIGGRVRELAWVLMISALISSSAELLNLYFQAWHYTMVSSSPLKFTLTLFFSWAVFLPVLFSLERAAEHSGLFTFLTKMPAFKIKVSGYAVTAAGLAVLFYSLWNGSALLVFPAVFLVADGLCLVFLYPSVLREFFGGRYNRFFSFATAGLLWGKTRVLLAGMAGAKAVFSAPLTVDGRPDFWYYMSCALMGPLAYSLFSALSGNNFRSWENCPGGGIPRFRFVALFTAAAVTVSAALALIPVKQVLIRVGFY